MSDSPIPLPLDANGNIQLPNPNDIINYLPPDILNLGSQAVGAMQSAMEAVAGAQPAIDLISHISSGNPPDPQQVVGALAATAAAFNPVAGAVVGAIGEVAIGVEKLAEGVLDSLGLIDHPPPTYPYIGFIKKGDTVPTHPGDKWWKTYDYWMQPMGTEGWRWGTLPMNAESYYRQRSILQLLQALSTWGAPSSLSKIIFRNGPIAKNEFEQFFFPMLKKDLENWMNAAPSMSPRNLLKGAVAIWNHLHLPGNTVTYSAGDLPYPDPPQVYNTMFGVSPIDLILSVAGDISQNASEGFATSEDDITVNLGTSIVPAKTVVSTQSVAVQPPPIKLLAKASNTNIPGSTTYNPAIPDSTDPCVLYEYLKTINQQNSPTGLRLNDACNKQKAAQTVVHPVTQLPVTPKLAITQTRVTLKKDNSLLSAAAGATAGFAILNVPGAIIGAGIGFIVGKLTK